VEGIFYNSQFCSAISLSRKNAAGRGALGMANIFLSTSLIYLASEAAGCHKVNPKDGAVVIFECNRRIYGLTPSSLITTMAAISSVVSACFMPFLGVIIDSTRHRRTVGIVSASLLVMIQAVLIYTVRSTWFGMAIFLAGASCVYHIQVLTTISYQPEVADSIGEKETITFLSRMACVKIASGLVFLVLVLCVCLVWSLNSVLAAQISQMLTTAWILLAFLVGWQNLPSLSSPPYRDRPVLSDRSSYTNLAVKGFAQLWKTTASIHTIYRNSLRYFYPALAFADAAANSFSSVLLVFLKEQLKMNSYELGAHFLVGIILALPGTFLADFVTKRTNPQTSWMLSMLTFSFTSAIASFVLTGPSMAPISYVFSVLWGLNLGWYHPTKDVMFTMLVPHGEEGEFSGLYIFSSQILVWLPPLLFTILGENEIDLQWGFLLLMAFMLIPVALLHFTASWEDMVAEVGRLNTVKDGGVGRHLDNSNSDFNAGRGREARLQDQSSLSSESL
jgi:UMF1 family MFS transporter